MQKPVEGRTVHQDTDETKVIGILSGVIFILTILTVSSYADNHAQLVQSEIALEQNNGLTIEKSIDSGIGQGISQDIEQNTPAYLINASESPSKAGDERLKI